MAKQVLKVTKTTYFKRRLEQSSELSADELYKVEAGQEFEIESYAYADANGDFDEHIKVALKQGNLNGINTWFVFNRHAEIELDGEQVYPQEEEASCQVLKITHDTVLKRRPVPSSELSAEQKHNVPKETEFELHSYAYTDAKGNDFNHHIKFAIAEQDDYINGISTWYVYDEHAQVEFDDAVVYPLPELKSPSLTPAKPPTPAKPVTAFKGKKITLPGGRGTVYTDQPILSGGSFTWGEATHDGVRIPKSVEHTNNMINLAIHLEKARVQIGRPFRITSWYRPEPWNSRVGGARQSQHLTGKAVDIVVAGYMGRELGRKFMSWWPGGLGIYPGNRKHILHMDIGPKRHWGF
jgi:hypothetical protein